MLLNTSIYIVFALLMIVCALLLLIVLMQRPKQEGLGAAFGAQMTDQAFGAQTTDVLKKGTVLFGSLFMILCFVLAVLMNRQFQQKKSDLATAEQSVPVQVEKAPEATTPAPTINLEQYDKSAETPAATEPAPTPADKPADGELPPWLVEGETTTPTPAPAEPEPGWYAARVCELYA
ncbi:MAG: preprotein translocase subunit SecG, partial [Akkermansia sp.]|nr:preprotein translocase subunit SecG [Akkermansia sp.]